MTYAVLDCETTIFQKGNPFSYRNKLCLVGVRTNALNEIIQVEFDSTLPYAEAITRLKYLVGSVDTLVLFNAKFDLNWLARYGITVPYSVRIFDCQLAEFILGNQRPAYPSLDYCLAKYSLGSKFHNINDKYWSNGIDTPDIPLDELTEYLNEDLRQTDALYNRQLGSIPKEKQRLFDLQCQDLRILQEMEFNGQLFDWNQLAVAQQCADKELEKIDAHIRCEWLPEQAKEIFNIDSGDHLSCLLYGGVLRGKRASPYKRIYKTGPRAGETVDANRWEPYEYYLPRLVQPRQGSELKKDGFYSTDE